MHKLRVHGAPQARAHADISLARRKLGWEPKISLREGLERTIAWFKSADMSQYRPPTPNY